MKQITNIILLAGFILALIFNSSASAVEITFEKDQGYIAADEQGHDGNLSGQPEAGTRWSKTRDNEIRITADASGNQVARVSADGKGAFYKFNPTDPDLGGKFDPASSTLAFRMEIRMDELDANPGKYPPVVLRPRIGNDPAGKPIIALEILSSGAINYNDGKTLRNVLTVEKQKYLARKGQWVILEGQIHFATGRFTLSVDGMGQTGARDESVDMAFFDNTLTDRSACQLTLRALGGGNTQAVNVSIDNISLKIVVP